MGRRGLLFLLACGAFGIVALLSLLWQEHRTDITLPSPTGRFAVGRTSYWWINSARIDSLSPSEGAKREVVAWIWYPSSRSESAAAVEYLPRAWHAPRASSAGVLLSQFLTRDPSVVHVHSSSDPGVSPEQSVYPVVILRPGGSALTADFTTLAEDLASHGYVVRRTEAVSRYSRMGACSSGRRQPIPTTWMQPAERAALSRRSCPPGSRMRSSSSTNWCG